MKAIALVLLLTLAGGCSHTKIHASASASTGQAALPARSSVTSTATGGSVSVHVHSNSAAALVIAGLLVASAIDYAREDLPFPSFSTFSDWFRGTPAPELSPDRAISEQDCTRPIELSGNLRCR